MHADRRPFLLGRNAIQAALRGYFAARDFIEVDTATLQISPGNEAHLHAFATQAIGNDGTPQPLYLHTSPEFACKKLLAAGEQRIACFAHVYRNRERGPLHHPEFTMLEWYRVGQEYTVLMQDCADFLRLAAEKAGASVLRFRDRTCDPFAEPERLSVADAFGRHAGIDLLATLNADEPDEEAITVRQSKYLNNLIEQDHRNIKRRIRLMLGFKSFRRAQTLLTGIELSHMIRKGQYQHSQSEGLSPAEQFYLLTA